MNKAILVGRLGKSPELKSINNNVQVVTFPLATSKRWKDKEGNKQEKTTWHNIKFFGKQAEILNQYVKKGDQLVIEGEINNDTYEKDGKKFYFSEIVGSSFSFVGGKSASEEPKIEEGRDGLPF